MVRTNDDETKYMEASGVSSKHFCRVVTCLDDGGLLFWLWLRRLHALGTRFGEGIKMIGIPFKSV